MTGDGLPFLRVNALASPAASVDVPHASFRHPWTGYAEGRRYPLPASDAAAIVRRHGRSLGWAECGPLCGPRIVLCEPGVGLRYEIELRAVRGELWVLVRSECSNWLAVVDPLTAERVARLFGELEGQHLGPARERVRLPVDYPAWPADPGTLRGADRPRVRVHPWRVWRLPALTLAAFTLVALTTDLLAGQGLFATLFVGTLGALWAGLPLALAAFVLVGLVALAARARIEPRRERIERLLDGDAPLPARPRRAVDATPGGTEPEPALLAAPLRWQPLGGTLGTALRDWRRHVGAYSALAVVVLLIAVPLGCALQSTLTSVLPAAGRPGAPFAATAAGVLVALIGLPVLAGVMALVRRAALDGRDVDVVPAVAASVPRLPAYFVAQGAVVAGVLGIVLVGLLPGAVFAPLLLLSIPVSAVAALWFGVAHALVGPIVFVERDTRPLARSRELTRGSIATLGGWLLAAGATTWLAGAALAAAYELLVWRDPLVNWLPTGLLRTGESLLPFLVAPLPAAMLVAIYLGQRCLREDLDLALARGEEPATVEAHAEPVRDAPEHAGHLILDLPVPAAVAFVVALGLGLYLAPQLEASRATGSARGAGVTAAGRASTGGPAATHPTAEQTGAERRR